MRVMTFSKDTVPLSTVKSGLQQVIPTHYILVLVSQCKHVQTYMIREGVQSEFFVKICHRGSQVDHDACGA